MNIFISCGIQKRSKRCPAWQMYCSVNSRLALSYGKKMWDDGKANVYILSAKHGLLPLDKEIEPYSKTLVDASEEVVEKWAEKVIIQMKRAKVDFDAKTVWLTTTAYSDPIKDHFKRSEFPLDGKGVGAQAGVTKALCKKIGAKLIELDDEDMPAPDTDTHLIASRNESLCSYLKRVLFESK